MLQLLAGEDASGQAVMEQLEAFAMEEKGCFELIRSPLFVRNLAAGDVFRLQEGSKGRFTIVRRSGKLAIRVFSREDVEGLALNLSPEVEKLDGSLDLQTPRALVYSLHVNIGFSAIEQLFDSFMTRYPDTVWYYGNIYDPQDGVTPLNWWDDFINQI